MTNDQIGIILKDIQTKTDKLQTEVSQNSIALKEVQGDVSQNNSALKELQGDVRQTGVIVEDTQDNMVRLGEAMGSMRDEMHGMKINVDKIPEMLDDLKAIKAVLTDHNSELKNHETRITVLETARA